MLQGTFLQYLGTYMSCRPRPSPRSARRPPSRCSVPTSRRAGAPPPGPPPRHASSLGKHCLKCRARVDLHTHFRLAFRARGARCDGACDGPHPRDIRFESGCKLQLRAIRALHRLHPWAAHSKPVVPDVLYAYGPLNLVGTVSLHNSPTCRSKCNLCSEKP